jgi:hypothetical protein
MKDKFNKDLEGKINKISKEAFKDVPYMGPVGGGLYQIGEGCFTGKQGYDDFIEALKEEAKKKWDIKDD